MSMALAVARNVAARLKSRWRLRSHHRQGIILASKRATILSFKAARFHLVDIPLAALVADWR
jgi:hypothetical protein